MFVLTNGSRRLYPIHYRHRCIHDNEIWILGDCLLDRFVAVGRFKDLEPVMFEELFHHLADILIVFRNEYAFTHGPNLPRDPVEKTWPTYVFLRAKR